MKFAVAGLLALLAVSAQCGGIAQYSSWPYASAYSTAAVHAQPWGYGSYGYNAAPITQYSSYPAVSYASHVAAPSVYSAHVAAPSVYSAHVAAPSVYAAHVSPYSYGAHVSPYAYGAHVAPVAYAKHGATYTAATRGAVHTAPLEGHALSQTSLNVAPAPGTW